MGSHRPCGPGERRRREEALEGGVPEVLIIGAGSILVFFSAFCFGAAIWRQIFAEPPPPRPDVPRIRPELLMIVNGFLVLVALSALFGIWFGRTGGD